jgi:phage gpG-like protein
VLAIQARARDTEPIGRIIIRILEAAAQRAFVEQRLGEHAWPQRYPSQPDPFVNVAALVNWTSSGGNVLERFFDRRPALMATGSLAGSISGRLRGGVVEVGSALEYAGLHQTGGTSSQPITMAAKAAIAQFLGWEQDASGSWVPRKRAGSRQKENYRKYGSKLLWLLMADELTTEVVRRPFLGITEEVGREIAEAIEQYVATGQE